MGKGLIVLSPFLFTTSKLINLERLPRGQLLWTKQEQIHNAILAWRVMCGLKLKSLSCWSAT